MAEFGHRLTYTPQHAAQSEVNMDPLYGGGAGAGMWGPTDILGMMEEMQTLQNAWAEQEYLRQQRAAEEEMQRQLRMDQTMRTREASGKLTPTAAAQEPMPFRDMMQTKSVLEGMTPFNIGGGTNVAFRHMPAAAAFSGMALPSGFSTYSELARSAPPADPLAQARAESFGAGTEYQEAMTTQDMLERMYPPLLPGQYGSGGL